MTGKPKKQRPPASYRKRSYRRLINPGGLHSFCIKVKQTDLHILASAELSAEAGTVVLGLRNQLENYIAAHPSFLTSLVPLPPDSLAPPLIRDMLKAGAAAGVGPMAAVAGAIAEHVGRGLLAAAAEIVVENGGDIFMQRDTDSLVGIFAGTSSFTYRIGIRITPDRMPLGVCTSSGMVGHSLSLGRADSVTVIASSVALADAAATRLGNEIKNPRDIQPTLELAGDIGGISGVLIVKDEQLGAWGEVELVRL